MTTTITQDNFDSEVGSSDLPVLVDFWAEWCQPCRLVDPEVKALAAEQGARLKVGKLNIDEEPDVASKYSVFSIPTLILFVDGQEKVRLVGARRKDAILQEIESHLEVTTSA